jgi:hypothetical protein
LTQLPQIGDSDFAVSTLEIVNHLIANKNNLAVKPVQMLAQLHYVFTPKNVSARPGIGEIAHYRRHRPGGFAPLLPALLSLVCPVANAPEVKL